MSRALFSVGEMVIDVTGLSKTSGAVEILHLSHFNNQVRENQDGEESTVDGWAYQLATDEEGCLTSERWLKKYYPPADFTYDELMHNLNTEKQEA